MADAVFILVLIIGGVATMALGLMRRRNAHHSRDYEASMAGPGMLLGGLVLTALGFIWLLFSVMHVVDDGFVGVTKSFGEYGEATLQPGVNIIMPWESVVEVDTRVKAYTFSDDADEAIAGPISAQASRGGNLTIEHTVQLQVNKDTADDLLRTVGEDWFKVIGLPPIRSCTRDAPVNMTVEEAYTTKRTQIGERTMDCVIESVADYGIIILDVLIRDVDPGEAVRQTIDQKEQTQQELQLAGINVQKAEEEAREEAIRAFGTSQAEQIIACGGTEEVRVVNGEERTVIVPKVTCEDQFSAEYLQWMYINQLSEIDGVVVLPPQFDGNLFIQPPTPAPAQG